MKTPLALSPRQKGLIAAIITATCWSTLALFLKYALNYSDSQTIVWYRMLVAFLFLLVWFVFRGETRQLEVLKTRPGFLLVAALCLAFNYLGFVQGIHYSSPANAQIFIQLGPFLLALSGLLFFGEKLSSKQILGAVICTVGFSLFFWDRMTVSQENSKRFLLGFVWIIGAALTWATFAGLQKKLLTSWKNSQINIYIYMIITLVCLPWVNWSSLAQMSPGIHLFYIFLGLNTLVAYGCFSVALRYLPATQVSPIITMNPLFTLVFINIMDWLHWTFIPPDPVTVTGYMGAVGAVIGVILVLSKKPRISHKSSGRSGLNSLVVFLFAGLTGFSHKLFASDMKGSTLYEKYGLEESIPLSHKVSRTKPLSTKSGDGSGASGTSGTDGSGTSGTDGSGTSGTDGSGTSGTDGSNPLNSGNPVNEYKQALESVNRKETCKTLKKLSEKSSFVLRELALIRRNQHCKTSSQWESLGIENDILIPFFHQALFGNEMAKKNFKTAYQIFKKNRKWIQISHEDFEKMAVGALRTGLSSNEKKQLLRELHNKSPRFIPHPGKKDFIRVARDYRRHRQFKKALFYYEKIKGDSKMDEKTRWQAFKGIRLTYKLEKWTKTTEYIRASGEWADFLRGQYLQSKQLTDLHHDANIEYIRTLWTEGQDQARLVLEQLKKELKGHHSLQLVYWLKGRMAEEKKQYEQAVSWLERASREESLSDRHRERVLWSLAWNQRRVKKFKDSQKTLELLKKNPDITLFAKSQYLYWQAENLASMGHSLEAKKILKDLAELDLYGYYGSLAYRKLKIPFPSVPRVQWHKKDLLNFLKKEDQNFFLALVESGEWEVAQAMVLGKVKTDRNWTTLKWAHYLALLQKSGAYSKAFELYHRLSAKKQRTILEEYAFLLFPRPYENIVTDSVMETKMSPSLIYSIMKQESGFNIRARSPADAFGLLQLIPRIAKEVNRKVISVNYKTPEDLYKPEVIIPLGAKKLSQLFLRFKGHFIPAVASYNSTEKVVLGWVQNRFQGDPIAFIEDIPYHETKNYVRLVMKNYIAYNRFHLEQKNFEFPEICLQGLEKFKSPVISD